jgi:hypothetical protein
MNPLNTKRKKSKFIEEGESLTGIKPDLAGGNKRKRLDSPTMWELSRISGGQLLMNKGEKSEA